MAEGQDDAGKRAKSSVDYSRSTGSDRCDGCVNFIAPDRCQRVKGAIEPDYWCRLFEARK